LCHTWLPARTTGRSAPSRPAAAWLTSAGSPAIRPGERYWPGSTTASSGTAAKSTSAGISTNTGPGRPAYARRNAIPRTPGRAAGGALGVVAGGGELGDGRQDAAVVQFLQRAHVGLPQRPLAADEQHGDLGPPGVGHGGDGVGGPRAGGDGGAAGHAGEPGPG